jgi:predicted amidophosphoribosyltransferase
VRGLKQRLSNENLDDAMTWFAMFTSDYLKHQKIRGPFLVVPLPNSDCLAGTTTKPRTRKLAKAICDTLKDGSTVLDCLRWKKNLGSASKAGGPREAPILHGNLTVLKDVLRAGLKGMDDGTKVLLVDDVTTSGGHLQACAAKLEPEGVVVDIVVCGGKTVYDQSNPAFHIYEYELDKYKP